MSPDPAAPVSRQRARPYPRPGRLITGVLLEVACKGLSLWAVVALVMIVRKADPEDIFQTDRFWAIQLLAAILLYVVFALFRYNHGRHTTCPLCHGTPFHASRAHKHRDATKWPLLGHRASTAFSLLLTGQYNCMYCGTPFRLRR